MFQYFTINFTSYNCDFFKLHVTIYFLFCTLQKRASINIRGISYINFLNINLCVCLLCYSFSFTGETINECLLVLHTAATGVCQLYLALLHLRRAGQHFVIAWHIDYTADCINENVLRYGTQSGHFLKPRRKGPAAVHFLEGACLLWESLSLFLAVVSTLCVAVRHVLQAALFLIVSTVRWPQKMLLSKEDLDEWEKEQKKERKELQEQRQQVEKYLTVVEHFPSLHKTKRS